MTTQATQTSDNTLLINTLDALNIRPVSVGINTEKCHDLLGKIQYNRITFKKSHYMYFYGLWQNGKKVRTIHTPKVRTIQPFSEFGIIHKNTYNRNFKPKKEKIKKLLKKLLL